MGLLDYIRDWISDTSRVFAKDIERQIFGRIMFRVKEFKRKLIKDIAAVLIIVISLAFLSVAAIYFMIEYLHFTKTISFAIVGIVLLIIGIIIKLIR